MISFGPTIHGAHSPDEREYFFCSKNIEVCFGNFTKIFRLRSKNIEDRIKEIPDVIGIFMLSASLLLVTIIY